MLDQKRATRIQVVHLFSAGVKPFEREGPRGWRLDGDPDLGQIRHDHIGPSPAQV